MNEIPFSLPFLTGEEERNLSEALKARHLHGDGPFTKRCHAWLKSIYGAPGLLTHSCTAALEMAAMLANIVAGDEVIMPSYTFVSTANSFVLRGAIPVFVDIRPDTFNLDENLLEQALTSRTRAIIPVHYAGVACNMDAICSFANKHNLIVIEDAAQAMGAKLKGKPLGTHGKLSAFSFHQTKNITSGEGGALVVNDPNLFERAQIIREKGTNRHQFTRKEVDKYEWLDIGSSYLPSDLLAAVLLPQLEKIEEITQKRLKLWNLYHDTLADLEKKGVLRRPVIPADCEHNAHIYHVLLSDAGKRRDIISNLKKQGIKATSHYVPLHSTPGGKRFGRTVGNMKITEYVAASILRLPLFPDLKETDVDIITNILKRCF